MALNSNREKIQDSSAVSSQDGLPELLEGQESLSELQRLVDKYPLPSSDFTYAYGTAGFRYEAHLLPPVFVRVGILTALLPKTSVGGIMITASHNDESYNGLKIASPNGGMMNEEGEQLAVQVVNDRQLDVSKLLGSLNLSQKVIHIGRDTRSHSVSLSQLLIRSIRATGSTVIDHGIVTTPMLHHLVLHSNPQFLPLYMPIKATNSHGYVSLMADSYVALLGLQPQLSFLSNKVTSTCVPVQRMPLVVDCASGVGYPALSKVISRLRQIGCNRHFQLYNGPSTGDESTLNQGCGSEFVQKKIQAPKWYDNEPPSDQSYCASLDGDADRIVFFSNADSFHLLDGDKIACLLANFFQTLIDTVVQHVSDLPSLSLGVVQTAYANGASTHYLKENKIATRMAKTGVKHVHHVAAHEFDIGIYFEANGHGTVLFNNPAFEAWLSQARQKNSELLSLEAQGAISALQLLANLINPAVGDAISDLLLVDVILQLTQQGVADWISMYEDFPSRQEKVKVKDRTIILTNENESKCLEPNGVQNALEQAMQEVSEDGKVGRCFIRPSGTEDVVRVYAEASTREAAETLCQRSIEIVMSLCGGVQSKM